MIAARTVGLVALGGAIGTLLRDGLGRVAPAGPGTFPTMILAINLVGSYCLGLLLGALTRHRPHDETWRPFLGVGVLGGFTTFSSFAVATVQLLRADRISLAMAYIAASVVGGFIAAFAGERCARISPWLVVEDEQ